MRLVLASVAMLALAACGKSSSAPSHASRAVITGIVNSAPTCPVERVGTPCPPRPVAGAEVVATRGTTLRVVTHTDRQGRFRFTLDYGTYAIEATNVGGLGSTATKTVEVGPSTGPIELTVDSGIR